MNHTWDAPPDPLEALQEGDRSPFDAFVNSAAGDLLGFFRRLGALAAEAEDLTQEVFLKMYSNHAQYQPQGRFRAYVLRAARNAWVDACRRRNARLPTVNLALGRNADAHEQADWLDPWDENQAEPGAALGLAEEGQRIQAALALLSEGHRQVFELGVVQELPYQQIAEVLDVPVGTIKSRMYHAVRKLRESLGSDAQDPGKQGEA